MPHANWMVYRLTSPSGGSYIGLTGQKLARRWRQHQTGTTQNRPRHPLSRAIRKYGADQFQVEPIMVGLTHEEAIAMEVASITIEKPRYNLSPGGELDAEAGRKAMAVLMSDPSWMAGYRARLSAGCRNSRAHRDRVAFIEARAAQWRQENPREAYALAVNGLEKANATNKAKNAARLAVLPAPLRRAPTNEARRQVRKRWAKCQAFLAHADENYRRDVGPLSAENFDRVLADRARLVKREKAVRIAQSLRAYNADLTTEKLAIRDARLAETRQSIDHDIRLQRQAEAFNRYRRTASFAEPTT